MVGRLEDEFRRKPWLKTSPQRSENVHRLSTREADWHRDGADLDANDAIGLMMTGRLVRVEIPLGSVYNLRRVGDLLHGLADQLAVLSRRDDIPPRAILFQARQEARATNALLRRMTRKKGERG